MMQSTSVFQSMSAYSGWISYHVQSIFSSFFTISSSGEKTSTHISFKSSHSSRMTGTMCVNHHFSLASSIWSFFMAFILSGVNDRSSHVCVFLVHVSDISYREDEYDDNKGEEYVLSVSRLYACVFSVLHGRCGYG